MTDNNYTHIVYVLDRSGSMASVREATITGFNTFLNSQKSEPGRCTFSLVKFDHEYDVAMNFVPLSEVPPLDTTTFVPRGNTALFDAIGKTIEDIGKKLEAIPESQRPGKVLIMIHTDGQENSSRIYDRYRIKSMIQHQDSKYLWKFVFVGTNQDAVLEAETIGIPRGNSLTYENTSRGISQAYTLMDCSLKNYRNTDNAAVANATSFFLDKDAPVTGDLSITKTADSLKITSKNQV